MAHLLEFLMKPSDEELGTIDNIGEFNEMNPDFMSSEFFDHVMSLERENLTTTLESDVNGLLAAADGDSSITDGSYFDYLSNETQSFGDALSVTDGLSHSDALSHTDGLLSPGAISIDGDHNSANESLINVESPTYVDIKEELEDTNSQLLKEISDAATISLPADKIVSNTNNVYTIIKQEMLPATSPTKVFVRQSSPKKIILSNNNHGSKNRKQLLRVQSLNGNGKSVLLPLNMKNLKKIRIVNTADMKLENVKTTVSHSVLKKAPSEVYALSSSESVDDDMDMEMEMEPTNSRYPPLNLTAEEKRLLVKEGISLPTHYPLTKNEEKDLKRIRRKIRNKISAQDSRKRKKEYVDKLEEKAKRTTEENEFLRKKIKLLHKQNNKLMEQMKKLQALLFNTSSSRATPTTCLMIVLFSTLLVCLPNLKISEKTDVGDQQLVAARRALLFNQGVPEDEVNMDDFLLFNKDDESEESLEEDVAEVDNNTDKASVFAKFLEELSKKYEHPPDATKCGQKQGQGYLFDFCNQYQDDIKGVIDNMKEFFEKNGTVEPIVSKKFIEPDISDDEDAILVNSGQKRKHSDLTDDRLVKRGKMEYEDMHPIMEDVVSTTVESQLLSSKRK